MKKMKKGGILLPFMLVLILGATLLILSIKQTSKSRDLVAIQSPIIWLDLHLISVKEWCKQQLKNRTINAQNFTTTTLQIGDYHYTIVLKEFDDKLTNVKLYFVDIYGAYRDSKKEFLQEFSTRRSFILNL